MDLVRWHNSVERILRMWTREHGMKALRLLLYRRDICIVGGERPFCISCERDSCPEVDGVSQREGSLVDLAKVIVKLDVG